ncbi:hypothetical protein TL16_g12480 [Triparma laevis f. inornata]|uniref:Uncharacterized protein n=1 Tax=Triparma laevis f. inornata TaxID=1714386 RepID=A0A9W7BM28_9STRA|nr:hypothetical protein TL16_g12480 [Triparma laevis f. inornata]
MSHRKPTFEETWERYAWLSQDIKKEKAAHERRRAKVKVQEGEDNLESYSEQQVRKNIIRAKLSLTTPKYGNLEGLKRSSSLGGLFYPKPGSQAGALEILQRKETAQVAFKQVQEMQLPSWAFEIGLTKDNMKDMTMDLIERGYNGGGGDEGVEDGEERLKRKKEKERRKEEEAKAKAKRARLKKARAPLSGGLLGKLTEDSKLKKKVEGRNGGLLADEEEAKRQDTENRTMYERQGFDKRQPSSGSMGVSVSISATGDILSTVKPEFEFLSSKPCLYKPEGRHILTNTMRPATTPNFCLDYEGFKVNKTRVMETMKEHRKKVWEEKMKIDENRFTKVLQRRVIEAKENRRDVLKNERLHEERQTMWTQLVILAVMAQTNFMPRLEKGRRDRAIKLKRNESAVIIQRNWLHHFHHRMMQLVLAFKNLGLEFSLNVRIRRKHRSMEIIKNFFHKVQTEAGPQIVKTFMYNVRKAQTYVRQFLACRKARRELCGRFWLKIEAAIRNKIVSQNHQRHIVSQQILSEVPELMDTVYKFRAAKGKARRAISKMKMVEVERHKKNAAFSHERNHGKNHGHGGHGHSLKSADRRQSSSGLPPRPDKKKEEHSSSNNNNNKDSVDLVQKQLEAKKKRNAALNQFIPPNVREHIVHAYVRKMRINYLDHTKGFVATTENYVVETNEEVKVLFEDGKGSLQKMRVLAEDLMTTRALDRPMFCLFTGKYPDKDTGSIASWYDIILSEVEKDIHRRKKDDAPVVFRPASDIDEMLERYKHERYEKSRAAAMLRLE